MIINTYLGSFACLLLGIMFGLLAIVLTVLGKKGANLISGFNSLSKAQRELYDTERMNKDQRNATLLWTIIMIVGAIFSFLISQYVAIVAFFIWFIVFCKDVHFDTEKAFGKYKIK